MTEPKDYFINPCCFGDDLAEWLAEELRKLGMKTDEKPGQEDFGWYLDFEVAGILVGTILGRRNRRIQASAAEAIHRILVDSPQIRDVRWHYSHDFDKGNEDGGAPSP